MSKSVKLKNNIYWDASGIVISHTDTNGNVTRKTLDQVAPTDIYSADSQHMMSGKAVHAAIQARINEISGN